MNEYVNLVQNNVKEVYGIDLDSDGNIYFAMKDNSDVFKLMMLSDDYFDIDTSGCVFTLLNYSAIEYPMDVVVDSSGNIIFTEDHLAGTDYLKMLPAGYNLTNTTENSVNVSILLDNVVDPKGLAVDSSGNIYFVNNTKVCMLPNGYHSDDPSANAVNVSEILIDLTSPYGLAMDRDENLYIADTGSSKLLKLWSGFKTNDPENNTVLTLLENLNNVYDVDIDPNGNVFYCNASKIHMLPMDYSEHYPDSNTNDIVSLNYLSSPNCKSLAIEPGCNIIYSSDLGSSGYLRKLRNTGTSSILADTDFDGLYDGFDIKNSTNIIQCGELNVSEGNGHSYQLEADSDRDRLPDGYVGSGCAER